MFFTCCLVQNPALTPQLLLESEMALLLLPYPFLPLIPSQLLLLSLLGCWSWEGSPKLYVPVDDIGSIEEGGSNSFGNSHRYPLVWGFLELGGYVSLVEDGECFAYVINVNKLIEQEWIERDWGQRLCRGHVGIGMSESRRCRAWGHRV